MKIHFNEISGHQVINYDSTLDNYFKGETKIIKKINKTTGSIKFEKVDHTLICDVNLTVNLNVLSSYSNIPFDTNMRIVDQLFFTDSKELESDDIILVKDEIDMDYYIYSLILTSIPYNIHKNGEKLPSGQGYRVISEDDYLKEKNNQKPESNNAFSKLDGIDFDK